MDTKSLPTNVDAERFVLGSILLDNTHYVSVVGALQPDDFSLEKHRRIYARMGAIHERGETIDRITVANELLKAGELESCDGLSYIVSLDDGLPSIPNVESYVRIVRDKAILRKICFAGHGLIGAACEPDANPGNLLASASTQFLALAERGQERALMTPADIIDREGGLSSYLDRRNRTTGISSGYASLDSMTGGFKPGALYILAARPAMGKTALGMNVAENIVLPADKQPRGSVLVFTLEMDSKSLLDRMICSRGNVNTRRFDGGWMDKDERARVAGSLSDIVEAPILFDDTAITNLHGIHSKIRQQQARGPVALVILDYLQLMIEGDAKNRVAETSMLSRGWKLIAKDCKVPVLALAQLSRACEQRDDKRPMLSDLRESGAIEQDADVVMFIYRGEVYYPDREDLRGTADLLVRKQRGGPTGDIPLVWLKEIVRFKERARTADAHSNLSL